MSESVLWHSNSYNAILVLRDDCSNFVDLAPVSAQRASDAAFHYIEWTSRYNTPAILCVDRGTHFVNQLFDRILERTPLGQILPTIASNKRTAGGIEIVNRKVRDTFRQILSEAQLPMEHWIHVIPLVRHYLNNLPRTTLAGHAPIELFQGRPRESPLSVWVEHDVALNKALGALNGQSPRIKELFQELASAIAFRTTQAVTSAEKNRDRRRTAENAKLPAAAFELFEIGDFVLRAVPADTPEGLTRDKSALRHFPMRVVDTVSDHVYLVEDLVTGGIREEHSQRLAPYATVSELILNPRLVKQIIHDRGLREIRAITAGRMILDKMHLCLEFGAANDADSEWWSAKKVRQQCSAAQLRRLCAHLPQDDPIVLALLR